MTKTALVTGGAGFIGSHLVYELLQLGYDVIVVDDLSLGKLDNLSMIDSLYFAKLDARFYHTIESLISELVGSVDVIFNLAVVPLPASLSSPRATFDTNTMITSTMCDLVREGYAKTLVQFSSSEVYGSAVHVPMDESHPPNCLTPYAASKYASDLLVQSYGHTFGIDYAIVRPFNTIGPRQNAGSYAGVVPATVTRCMRGKPPVIHGDGSYTRDYSYVTDVVRAAIDIYNTPLAHGRVINIGSGVETSVEQIVAMIAGCFGPDCDVVHDSERPGDVRRMVADTSLARRLIQYEPRVSLAEAIEGTVLWYINSGRPW